MSCSNVISILLPQDIGLRSVLMCFLPLILFVEIEPHDASTDAEKCSHRQGGSVAFPICMKLILESVSQHRRKTLTVWWVIVRLVSSNCDRLSDGVDQGQICSPVTINDIDPFGGRQPTF